MKSYKIEVCCGSAQDAINAYKGGAYRVELCSDMFHGGLTPSLGTFLTVKEHTDIKINVMLRPRECGFNYTEVEWESLLRDARIFKEHGADGFVCGFLHDDGRINVERTKKIVEIAGDIPVTFHRAIDVVPDWKEAIDILHDCGVKRILTSGQKPSVLLSLKTLKEMREYANGRLIIMPGGGVTFDTVDEIVEYTGCEEIHVHFTKKVTDMSASNNRKIHFGAALYPSETEYSEIDEKLISEVTKYLK